MIPLRDNQVNRPAPVVTYTLIGLNCLIYLWDRNFNFSHIFGPGEVFTNLVMRPNEVAAAFHGGDRFALVTMFTAMFLHQNLLHLLGNMLFLLTFGHGVEVALGPLRFALYYLAWGILAAATHTLVNPSSLAPTLGASGAIGGVLGCYFLLFPGNKIELLIPFVFVPVVTSAWVLLGIWFLWQVLIPQQGVANWAHVGGFVAGMLTVLIMGGRAAILKGKEQEFDYRFV
ncbi:MAG TPA: rhomboid family intramembrane serine protease [Fimbriimonadaceae bacterium]|jgi:membrane associated rhomboid family serine protease